MSRVLSARAYGAPVPQGSKRFLGNGRMVEASQARLRPWRLTVTTAAEQANPAREPVTGPVAVRLWFTFPRPKAHYGRRDGQPYLRGDAPSHHVARPDIDKVTRAVLDALTDAAWWADDSQVAVLEVAKRYGDTREVGVEMKAWES